MQIGTQTYARIYSYKRYKKLLNLRSPIGNKPDPGTVLYKSPVHLNLDLESLHLNLLLYFFFKNADKNTSGGLILSLEKFGLILYSNFLQKIFM